MGVATFRCCGCTGNNTTCLDSGSPTKKLLCEKVINLNPSCQPNLKMA